ncbi:MAG: general secretion pathway protein K [Candidatus Paceibacteria bacterium]|jgi:general secretion pathway protein K
MHLPRRPRHRQQGFVLATTLWILAIITIGASYFAVRVGNSLELARQSRRTSEALVDFSGTRAELLFRLATTYPGLAGVGPTPATAIVLDGRRYQGTGQGDTVRLQDTNGLLNLNFIQPDPLLRLLAQLDVPFERRGPLLDTLNDYIDTDDLRRLNGAESQEYSRLGLPPPANDWLTTPLQLRRVIGWRDEAGLWKGDRLTNLVTTSRSLFFNPNVAPRELLAAYFDVIPEVADQLILSRQIIPFSNDKQITAITQMPVRSVDSLYFYPGTTIRFTQESEKIPWAVQSQVMFTLSSSDAPWRIDYTLKTSSTTTTQNAKDSFPLPERAKAPPLTFEAF